jgi:polysaccharide biosynthesis transport protein
MVNPQVGSRLVQVSFEAGSPELAAGVVNTVMDVYLQMRMEDATESASWLEGQLRTAQQRLEDSERRLQAYIATHGLQVMETGKGETAQVVNERLQLLHDAMAKAQADRIEKQSAVEQAEQRASSRDLDSPVVQNLSLRLAELRREHARLSTVFQDDYPTVKAINSQVAEIEQALNGEIALIVRRAQRDYRAAVRTEGLLHEALDQQNAIVQQLGRWTPGSDGYEVLKRNVVTNQDQFAVLNQKLKELSVSAALNAARVGILDRAAPPSDPYGPAPWLIIALGGIVGVLLATGSVFLQDYFDTSMRTSTDVDAYLGVRTLAAIPSVRPSLKLLPSSSFARSRRQWRRIDEAGAGQSPLGDAFAALRTAVLLRDPAARPRSLLITSAHPEEGKTTVSLNLALSLTRLNHRVLLIDANMRYPCVRDALGLTGQPGGLVRYLVDRSDWHTCLDAYPHTELDVLTGGIPERSPADLLSLPRMRELVAAASREYDFVVMDSPALLTHPADVKCLAALVDNVLLTVRQGDTPREAVSLALAQLDRVSGVVLNRADGPIPVVHAGVA